MSACAARSDLQATGDRGTWRCFRPRRPLPRCRSFGTWTGVARAGHQPVAEAGITADLALRHHREFAVGDDRRLGGGAAHVEDHQFAQAVRLGEALRADHACSRPRLDDENRILPRQFSQAGPHRSIA